MNSNNRTAATLFPRGIVCLRNVSRNTLHKGDDDDEDDNNNATIAKSEKGNSVVILKIQDYTDRITDFINDNHFAKINTDPTNSFINTN
jgi:hypothetical protein